MGLSNIVTDLNGAPERTAEEVREELEEVRWEWEAAEYSLGARNRPLVGVHHGFAPGVGVFGGVALAVVGLVLAVLGLSLGQEIAAILGAPILVTGVAMAIFARSAAKRYAETRARHLERLESLEAELARLEEES